MNIIKNEPALISGLVSAIIALAISFGAGLSDEQVGSIMAVVTIGLAIAVRAVVTPTNKIDTPVQPPAGEPL